VAKRKIFLFHNRVNRKKEGSHPEVNRENKKEKPFETNMVRQNRVQREGKISLKKINDKV